MKMRIVAMTSHDVTVQIKMRTHWWQTCLEEAEFLEFVRQHFPTAAEQAGDNIEDYYHYGETPEMQIKGEAYIFESEE